jgi:hypothetical protein
MEPEEIEKTSDSFLSIIQADLGLPEFIIIKLERKKPMIVKNIDLNPSYWFVPLTYKDSLVGFLHLTLDGEIMAYGRFMQKDKEYIPINYLSKETAYAEITKSFGEVHNRIGCPHLIHDGPPQKLTWMSVAKKDDEPFYLFWAFGEPYSRREKEIDKYLI